MRMTCAACHFDRRHQEVSGEGLGTAHPAPRRGTGHPPRSTTNKRGVLPQSACNHAPRGVGRPPFGAAIRTRTPEHPPPHPSTPPQSAKAPPTAPLSGGTPCAPPHPPLWPRGRPRWGREGGGAVQPTPAPRFPPPSPALLPRPHHPSPAPCLSKLLSICRLSPPTGQVRPPAVSVRWPPAVSPNHPPRWSAPLAPSRTHFAPCRARRAGVKRLTASALSVARRGRGGGGGGGVGGAGGTGVASLRRTSSVQRWPCWALPVSAAVVVGGRGRSGGRQRSALSGGPWWRRSGDGDGNLGLMLAPSRRQQHPQLAAAAPIICS